MSESPWPSFSFRLWLNFSRGASWLLVTTLPMPLQPYHTFAFRVGTSLIGVIYATR
jgi:hypothetical protein